MVLLEIFDEDAVTKVAQLIPMQIQNTLENAETPKKPNPHRLSSVIAKYKSGSRGFSFFKGDVAPEDRQILESVVCTRKRYVT